MSTFNTKTKIYEPISFYVTKIATCTDCIRRFSVYFNNDEIENPSRFALVDKDDTAMLLSINSSITTLANKGTVFVQIQQVSDLAADGYTIVTLINRP